MPRQEERAVDSQDEARRRALTEELFEEIRAEAYFLWQQRGCPVGGDLTDWLAAEEKVLAEAQESVLA